ncbi:MAG: hypothetical protein R2751_16735 [Bacteroidales bacterium]
MDHQSLGRTALTWAMELKEDAANEVSSVTVVTVEMPGRWSPPRFCKAMAIGADDAIRVDSNAGDSFAVAA